LISAVLLTLFSKAVWVDVLHQAHALVGLDNPALISVPLALGSASRRPRRSIAVFRQTK
jgi:cation/acetate symporter